MLLQWYVIKNIYSFVIDGFVLAAKVTIAGTNCCIIDSDGNSKVLSEDTERSDLTETTRSLLEHAQWVGQDVNDCKML